MPCPPLTVYQRPYSWGTKQVFEMLQDFLSAYSAKQVWGKCVG